MYTCIVNRCSLRFKFEWLNKLILIRRCLLYQAPTNAEHDVIDRNTIYPVKG